MARLKSRSSRPHSLVSNRKLNDQLDLGIIDMTLTPTSLMDKKWGAIRHADLPFLWESFDHFVRAKNGDWGQAHGRTNARQLQYTRAGLVRVRIP